MTHRNTTRGVSHDPAEAAQQRKLRQNVEARRAIAEAKSARQAAIDAQRDERRQHGRTLDQVETCYRQYRPVQIHFSDDMCSVPVKTDDDTILRRDNCNFWFDNVDNSIMGADLL